MLEFGEVRIINSNKLRIQLRENGGFSNLYEIVFALSANIWFNSFIGLEVQTYL